MTHITPPNRQPGPSTVDAEDTALDPVQVLTFVLRRAAHAHHFHELALGGPHEDWPPWYAAHMANTLADHGYGLTFPSNGAGLDLTADPTAGVEAEAEANEARIAP